jgi:membrane protease YdiL (CAAX protease family)
VPRTVAGVVLGIVGGSLIFGATHLRNGRTGMAYASGFGVMFSVLYLITDNLIAVIVAHAAGNVLTVAQWAPRIEHARRAAAQQPATLPR